MSIRLPLRVLILEDQPADAEFMLDELRQAGFDPEWQRVQTKAEYLAHLDPALDVILADHKLPQFDGLTALTLLQERGLDIPFILVSGTIGEELAVTAIKQGATDYLLKDRLARLGPAVIRALEDRRLRVEKRAAEAALRESDELYRQIITSISDAVFLTDDHGKFILVCPNINLTFGWSADEVMAMHDLRSLIGPEPFVPDELDGEFRNVEWNTTDKSGDPHSVLVHIKHVHVGKAAWLYTCRDITERKRAEVILAASELRYRRLFEAAQDGVLILDAHTGQVLDVNPFLLSLLGYSLEDFQGKELWEIGLFRDIARSRESFLELQDKAYVRYENLPLETRDGRHIQVEFVSNVYLANGEKVIQCNVRDITERKRTEAALAAQHDLLRTVIDNVPDRIYAKDAGGRFILKNEADARQMGAASPGETIGKTDFDYYPPEMAEQYHADDQAIIQSGQPLINREEPVIDAEGNQGWILTTKVPLRNSRGEVIGLVGIGHDITVRKQTEIALRQSEAAERNQRLLAEALRDSAAALTSTLDSSLVMKRILESVGRVVPHDAASIMLIEGDFVHPVYWQAASPASEAALKTLRLPLDTPNLREMIATGHPVVIADTASYPGWLRSGVRSHIAAPMRVKGQVIGFLYLDSATSGFFTDSHAERLQAFADQAAVAIENAQLYDDLQRYAHVLEQRVAERTADVSRANEHLAAIINSSSDVIVVTGLEGVIVQCNPSFRGLFGLPPGETIGQSLAKLAAPNSVEALTEAWHEVVAEASPKYLEFVAQRDDGMLFDADAVLSPILGPDHGTTEVVCTIRDITRRKYVERELQELNRLKTEFLSTAAHELRTPLTTIRGFSELLLTRALDADHQRHYISLISEQAVQLGKVVDDLLDISRLEAKRRLALILEPLNMVELINQVVVPFRESALSHTIHIEAMPECPVIIGDPNRLSQVLKNLLSNAIKYSPQGGTITVVVRQTRQHLQISVQDQGIGMTPEQQAHMFEKFYRADASNTEITGTGLGLSICKLIVEMHSGEILVDSKWGVGSTFYFTLPLPDDQAGIL